MADEPKLNTIPAEFMEIILAEIRRGSPDGYAYFYLLLWNRDLPKHGDMWIKRIWQAWKDNKPVLLEAFRGSTKTTIVTNTLAAYLHGLYPNKTGLIVQSGDDSAIKNSAAVAEIIEHNDAFKFCFPWVVPDKERGWSSTGYNIKDSRVDYGEWTRTLSKDPSFVGYGYKSASIIGMHPSLYLFADDIHNEENTRSDIEIQHVKTTWNGTISPTRKPHNPLVILPFTPWRTNDLYAGLKETGAFEHIRTPVRDGDVYAWPEVINAEVMAQIEKEDTTGGVEVARMYDLDLESMSKKVFSYQSYPNHLIGHNWPMTGGLDYAGVADPNSRNPNQSHMALAYVAKSPENMAVVVDGVVEQCAMGQTLEYVKKAQSYYPNWSHVEIEGDGKGEEFMQLCMLAPDVVAHMSKTGNKNKAARLVNNLEPWLRIGKVRFSDANTPFLNTGRAFMNKYPNVGKHDPGWDVMDAVYRALVAMPDVLTLSKTEEELSKPIRRSRASNPWASLGQQEYA